MEKEMQIPWLGYSMMVILAASLVGCAHGKPLAAASPISVKQALPQPRVHFSTGRARVESGEMEKILENVLWLEANPLLNVVLEGHCDERGSDEANLKLGDSRARAVKAALIGGGLGDERRVVVISFGEGRPLDRGRSESAWKKNRRVDFVLQ